MRILSIPGQGHLEVNYNGVWATVCDDDWGDAETRVSDLVPNDENCFDKFCMCH